MSRGVGRPVERAGLTGYRYLLAVATLVVLTTSPMLVAVVAGSAALTRSPAPVVEATPFITYYPPADPDAVPPTAPESGRYDFLIDLRVRPLGGDGSDRVCFCGLWRGTGPHRLAV